METSVVTPTETSLHSPVEYTYKHGDNLPRNSWEYKVTQADLDQFLSENKEIQGLKGRSLWKGIAWVYATRLLRHVRTCSKKDLSSQNTKAFTLSAAIAYDKGFPKEEQLSSNPAMVTFNNLFLGSDVGQKVHQNLTKSLPLVQTTLRSYTEEGSPSAPDLVESNQVSDTKKVILRD